MIKRFDKGGEQSTQNNRQLIYDAINKNNHEMRDQEFHRRKIRQQSKVQTAKKQKQESFFNLNQHEISRIRKISYESNEITEQSRIDLDCFLSFEIKRQNNFIRPQKSRQQRLVQNQIISEYKNRKKQQNPKNIQQIFIIMSSSSKRKRISSMSPQQKPKFISIPLKYQQIKISQFPISSKKSLKSHQSLETKQSTNTCCTKNYDLQKCKYCLMIQKSNQAIKKIQSLKQQ